MAEFVTEASSSLTPVEHSNMIWRNSLKLMFLRGFMGGKGSGKSIVVDPTLTNNSGETINYHFVPFADVDPLLGQDVTIENNESAFDEFSTSVTVDEVNFAFKKRGKMTDQRTILNVRNEMSMQVAKHYAQYNEDVLFRVLSGMSFDETDASIQSSTGTTDRVNGANRCISSRGTSGFTVETEAGSDNASLIAAMATTDLITPKVIQRASVMARTSTPYKMQPLRVGPNNEEFFCLFISVEDAFHLMQDPDWLTRSISAADRGIDSDDIAKGALGVWKNVIVKESERIQKFGTSGSPEFNRNLLLGGDAAVLAWAQTLDYTEQWKDYRRQLGVTGTEIRGQVKLAYTNKDDTSSAIDYGVAQVITAAP